MSESTISVLITAIAGILTALITVIASVFTKIQEKRFELEKLKLQNELNIEKRKLQDELRKSKNPNIKHNQEKADLPIPKEFNSRDVFLGTNWIPTIVISLTTAAITVAIMLFLSSLRSPVLNLLPLETIQFDYVDSPTNHGWIIGDGDETLLTFERIVDAKVGNALKISTPADNLYALDYELSQKTREFGNFIDVVSKFDYDKNSFYAYLSMTNQSGKTQKGWLKFKIGKDKPLPSIKSTGEPEWLVSLNPEFFPNTD